MVKTYYDNSDEGQRFQDGTTAQGDAVDQKFDEAAAGFREVEKDTRRSLKFPFEPDMESQEFVGTAFQRRNRVLGFDNNGNIALVSGFYYRQDWAADTEYFLNDVVRDPATGNLYVAIAQHTSGTTPDFSDDTIWYLAIDADTVRVAREEAVAARDKAEQWADEDEDVPVETGRFSSKHHALKSAASASAASSSAGAASSSASSASSSAGAAQQAKTDAQALYGDLDAVNTAKTQSQQAATTATEQAGLATTAREDAEAALSNIGAAIDENNAEFGIGEPIVISPTLLADVVEPGDYWIATNSPADKPITRFCWLFVRRASSYTNVTQELKARDNGWEKCSRTSDDNGATWTDWSFNYGTGNLLNIGTTASSARIALNLGTAATVNVNAFATAAQGDLADSALQSGDLASVAFTGAYSALTGKPSLGTAASADVQTNQLNNNLGRVLLVGAGGLLTNRSGVSGQTPPIATDLDATYSTGFWGTDGNTLNNPDNRTVTGVIVGSDTARTYQIQITTDNDFRFRSGDSTSFGGWNDVWHSGNFDPSDVEPVTGSNSNGRYYLYPDGRLVMHCGIKTFTQDTAALRYLLANVTLPYTPVSGAEHYVTLNPSSDASDYSNGATPFNVGRTLAKPARQSGGTVVEVRTASIDGSNYSASATADMAVLIESRWK